MKSSADRRLEEVNTGTEVCREHEMWYRTKRSYAKMRLNRSDQFLDTLRTLLPLMQLMASSEHHGKCLVMAQV